MTKLRRIERVLVEVDVSSDRLRACEAAASLAEQLDAELSGILVENEALLRSADLPSTREFGLSSSVVRACSRTTMESQLRVRAKRARQAFESIAARTRVSWSFEVRRVQLPPRFELSASRRDQSPVVVLLGGSQPWESAVDVALEIAKLESRSVQLLVVDGDVSLEGSIRDRLAGSTTPVALRHIGSLRELLADAAGRARVVVIPASHSGLLEAGVVAKLLELFGAPIVISR